MSGATQIVAIDGPAGAGKSSTARTVAQRLGFAFLDTGAMYRAATWWALHNQIDLDDPEALTQATQAMQLAMNETASGQQVVVNGHDVTEAIRSPEVTGLIYKLDQNSAVRRQLVALQRDFGERKATVAEGRDIGTVVFPQAHCKIYMDASPEVRAQRRVQQMQEKGQAADFDVILREIETRDRQAMERKDSPLRKADDAVLLDTSDMNFEEVVNAIITLAKEHLCL